MVPAGRREAAADRHSTIAGVNTDQGALPRFGPNDVLRLLLELFAFFSIGLWGFLAWPPLWNWAFGIGAPLFAIVLWGLFRSPRAVFHLDAFGKALVEIVIMGSAALAWLVIGQWIVAVLFGILAVVSGVVSGRKEFA
ncbi:4-amino-4-deoxy-L-arabinose transferase [Subtercola boreus]|uniref:4-amino-4-deoxy-L-arabinose transferase n=1 Tax=Subtercola boreus TaxID=120213 RepID=A0A3E0VUZ7_9MICO|nr:4-amino-4-deoxy-L-arabinose transferase [Subtercola boreus]